MTDNIMVMRDYMKDLGIPEKQQYRKDLYFDVQLIRRGKDNPDTPAANYTFKCYYIDSLELFDRYTEEIKQCCEMFKLRAYISVNAKSKIELSKKTLVKYAEMVALEESKKPWRFCDSVNGSMSGKEKRWVIDIDNCENDNQYLYYVREAIGRCSTKYDNAIVTTLPTKSGYHIITHPFNTYEFNNHCKDMGIETPEIKKNHITLLYENL